MKYINPQLVTHIIAYKETEGIYTKYYGLTKRMIYLPYKKSTLFTTSKVDGFYEDGKYSSKFTGIFISMSEIMTSNKRFIYENKLYTYPHIEIYVGDDLIHTKYFTLDRDMDKHILTNYPNLNITYI